MERFVFDLNNRAKHHNYLKSKGFTSKRTDLIKQRFVLCPIETNVSIPDLHSYQSQRDLYFYYNAYVETRLIVEGYQNSTSGSVVGAPAAEAALAYKAFTLSRDGLEDTSEWCLPTPAHLMIMFRWINEINAVLSAVWSSDFGLILTGHWSCGRWSNSEVYRCNFDLGGSLYVEPSVNLKAVRPICLT